MKIATPLTSQTPVTDSINSNDYTFVDIEIQDAVKRLQRKKIRTKIFATRGFASAGLEITGRGSPGA